MALDDGRLWSEVKLDGLGREWKSIQHEDTGQIETETRYDGLGRVWQVSNPYRSLNDRKWMTTQYDALGRVVAVKTEDTESEQAVVGTSYDLNTATVTDQAGRKRKSVTDALGRLAQVYEDPTPGLNYLTSYVYDVLDNLTGVTQGSQTRTFVYDSLGRLTDATNPESGHIGYGYDANGNLTSRVDARNITTTLGYDELNRLTGKSYSDGTPEARWCYDGKTYSGGDCTGSVQAGKKMRLTAVGSSVSATSFDEFDALGRVKQSTQTTGERNYLFGYSYQRDGSLATLTYPSGRQVIYSYDATGKLAAEYSPAAIANPGVRYLTADHLGSTRVVTGESGGALECRDYHAFGEEILVTAGRPRQGVPCYTADAGVRQKFTGKERDAETGLDYFGARYFSGAQGRFTTPDPLLNSGRPWEPQSWNRYSYTLNNPLKYTDPTGLYEWGACSGTDKECASYKKSFKDSLSYLKTARDSYDKKSREYKRLDASLKAYGKEGEKNGVSVGFGDLGGTAAGRTTPAGDMKSFSVMFDPAKMSSTDTAKWMAIDSGHEGTHVDDFKQMFAGASELSPFSVEYRGYESSAFVFQGLFTPSPLANQGTVMGGVTSRTLGYSGNIIWNTSWGAADKAALQSRDAAITNTVIQRYKHPETTPHNPWGN